MLQRNFYFEFAGMPKSGKTTITGIVAHFLKREGYLIKEYDGGSRYSPLNNASIVDLNLWLACKAVEFVVRTASCEETNHKIHLLDRGLIDRYIFTETLFRLRKIDGANAHNIQSFLTLPRILEKLDGIFIFVTSPEIALKREFKHKLVQFNDVKFEGEVMNANFLSLTKTVTIDSYYNTQSFVRNIQLIDTEQDNEQLQKTAKFVVDNILNVLMENRIGSTFS